MIDKVEGVVREWLQESGVNAVGVTVGYMAKDDDATITLYTDSELKLVGKDGALLDKYRVLIEEAEPAIKHIFLQVINAVVTQ